MSLTTDSILDKDLYELFGVLQDASVKDIKTAYRKKALECHPDKNPDNPKANELFHELSRALAVLIDQSARTAYDKLLNAKLAAKKRHEVLDSRRKKLKEDLEERERQAQDTSNDFKKDQENFEKELERLRKLSSKQIEEELSYVRNLIKERKSHQQNVEQNAVYRLKLKWSSKQPASYDPHMLEKIFSKYGLVSGIAMSSKKKGSALIEFSDRYAAVNAFKLEKGVVSNPLFISWVGPPPTDAHPENSSSVFNNLLNKEAVPILQRKQPSFQDYNDDFEEAVLRKLREAEQKKQHET